MNMSFNKQMCRQQFYQTGRDEAMRCLQLHMEMPRLGQPQMQTDAGNDSTSTRPLPLTERFSKMVNNT